MDIKFTWKEDKGRYTNGTELFIKNIRVGYIGWDASRPKDSNIPPYAISNMFNLKMKVTHFEKKEDGKMYLEKFVTNFLKYLTEGENK